MLQDEQTVHGIHVKVAARVGSWQVDFPRWHRAVVAAIPHPDHVLETEQGIYRVLIEIGGKGGRLLSA